jgi:hypothetical protein
MSFDEQSEPMADKIKLTDFEIDMAKLSSVTLSRLLDEVKYDEVVASSYDRVHNRHNR